MIVVDSSALLAIVMEEPQGGACRLALARADEVAISAGTLAEALIVGGPRGVAPVIARLVEAVGMAVMPVTADTATRMAEAYRRWGKGFHSANLNLGDCFAYALAEDLSAPLLFIGNDFSQTDLRPAL